MENGLRKKLGALEVKVNSLVAEVEKHLQNLKDQIEVVAEVTAAVREVVGVEDVNAAVAAARRDNRLKREAEQAAHRKMLTEKEVLVPLEAAADDSVLVIEETNGKTGDVGVVEVGVAHVSDPELKGLLIGKKAGESFSFKENSLVVKEIFRYDEVRAAALMKEQQEASVKAEQTEPQPNA